MKRRRFIQAMASVSAAPAVLVTQVNGRVVAQPEAARPAQGIELTVADAAAGTVPGFFDPEQFAALRRLADVLMPSNNGRPGALGAGVPEFLDFLIGHSPDDRQLLYRSGLDALNSESRRRLSVPFSELDSAGVEPLLAPLRRAWTPEPPVDPLSLFLAAAKEDVRKATVNSLEWNTSPSESDGRRPRGMGMYWYTIE